jgi:hypothetical protein
MSQNQPDVYFFYLGQNRIAIEKLWTLRIRLGTVAEARIDTDKNKCETDDKIRIKNQFKSLPAFNRTSCGRVCGTVREQFKLVNLESFDPATQKRCQRHLQKRISQRSNCTELKSKTRTSSTQAERQRPTAGWRKLSSGRTGSDWRSNWWHKSRIARSVCHAVRKSSPRARTISRAKIETGHENEWQRERLAL